MDRWEELPAKTTDDEWGVGRSSSVLLCLRPGSHHQGAGYSRSRPAQPLLHGDIAGPWGATILKIAKQYQKETDDLYRPAGQSRPLNVLLAIMKVFNKWKSNLQMGPMMS